MTGTVTVDAFEALVGSTFRVTGSWAPVAADGAPPDPEPQGSAGEDEPGPPDVELTLTEVVRIDRAGPFEQFRVTFVGPVATPLDQGTFVLDPPAGGLDAVLLVPTAEKGDVRVYTASLSVHRSPTESIGS